MKTGNTTPSVLVNTTTTARYNGNEVTITGRINNCEEYYSVNIPKGQEVIILDKRFNNALHAIYKTTQRRSHVFEIQNRCRLANATELPKTFNGFKKVDLEFKSLEESVNELIKKLNQATQTAQSAPAAPSLTAFQTPPTKSLCPVGIHQTIKQQFLELKSYSISDEKIIAHLDGLLGEFLTLPFNSSLTDTPLSLYGASLKPKIDYTGLLHQAKDKLTEVDFYDFQHYYNRGIRFEGLSPREAMLQAADRIKTPAFSTWLNQKLNPARKTVTTQELITAICLNDYDWRAMPVEAAA